MKWIRGIHEGWTVDPDMTILFDIDPKNCGGEMWKTVGAQTKVLKKTGFLEEVRAKLSEAC